MMKPGSYLINTSRGELVDEAALLQAVQSGHMAGAGLDVFVKEPPDPDSPFLHMPQFVVTPHGSSHTDGAMHAMGRMSMEECLRVLRGEVPKYPVKLGLRIVQHISGTRNNFMKHKRNEWVQGY